MTDISKFNIYDIKKFIQIKGRLLGIDFGLKRIGIAVSDQGQEISTSLLVIENDARTFQKIKSVIEEYNPSGVIVGLPRKLDGSLGEIAEDILKFVLKMEEEFQLPVAFWDERFSSKMAENVLLEFDLSRNKRKKIIDKLAASHILQNALDFLKFNN